jgi:lipopolysaccharide/colanic/teichoic acid biosynthesis glycosyltransferase
MPQSTRKTEVLAATLLLGLSSPLWLLIAAGIKLSDPGPVFYIASRAGLRGVPFRMFKFRTMRVAQERQSRIAAANDSRVFPFGALLRRFKLDELPQLLNIIRGEMAFVGPRPEDPWIVEKAYTMKDRETLDTLPGLTSPGTLYYYAQGEQHLANEDTESSYTAGPMRKKLELDREYMQTASAASDLRVVCQTLAVLLRLKFDE